MAVDTPGSAHDHYEKNQVSTPDVAKHDEYSKSSGRGGRRGCSPLAVAKTLLIVGTLLVVISIVYGTVLPKVIDKKIKSGVVVCDEGDVKIDYTDPYGDCHDCTPYYYTLRMFNVTNPEEYLATGAKLALQEVGPYVYRRRQIKLDVSFDGNNRVSYKQYTYHTYESSMSCSGCAETDVYTSFDVGYLNVLGQAGGEFNFLVSLVNGSFGKGTLSDDEIVSLVRANGTHMMRWVNGLNSLDPIAMKNVGSSVAAFLVTGLDAIANLDLSGFAYNGLFVKRTIKQWALGYPSLLAGLGLGSNYVEVCDKGGLMEKCNTCTGDACLEIWADCKQCRLGASVLAVNNVTCGVIESIMAESYGATEARSFAAGTCGLCTMVGLCAAPLPGIAEDSGMDWSAGPPPLSSLNTYTQRTGCDDLSAIGEYEMYNGDTSIALWATLDSRRNPSLAELAAFARYGNCANPTANMTCSKVQGADAQSLKPGGASISGFADTIKQASANMYLDQGKQEITVYNLNEEVKYKKIPLHRFAPSKDLLVATAANAVYGTGYPVDGVQPLGFVNGFLTYVSYPLFLYGDSSLLASIDLTMDDGTKATHETMYDSDSALKQAYADKYMTYLDIEAGTGKTMVARKRLQAAYALSKSPYNASTAMTDVLWPHLPMEVIFPAYWGEESATVAKNQVNQYMTIKRLLGSLLPVLIVGVIVGAGLVGGGFFQRRRALAQYKEVSMTSAI